MNFFFILKCYGSVDMTYTQRRGKNTFIIEVNWKILIIEANGQLLITEDS